MQKIISICQRIEKDTHFAYFFLSVLSVVVLYYNAAFWHSQYIGLIATVVYFGLATVWFARIVAVLFSLTRGWSLIFGLLTALILSSLFLAIPIALFRYTVAYFAMALLILALLGRCGQYITAVRHASIPEVDVTLQKNSRTVYTLPKYVVLLFIPLVCVAIGLLLTAQTGDFILSPWQVIPRLYVYIYVALTALTGLLLFSKRRGIVLLLVIIIHSFALHAYLPLVYETGFGGDKWRHIASERLVMTGEVYQPSLLGNREMAQIGPITIPAVFVSGNKTSYAQQWAITILFAEGLQVDVFYIDFWLMFLLWSFFMPLLLYKLAQTIRPGRQFALFFAFLPVLFYPLQVFGAITLPLSLGHIVFLYALYGWLLYMHDTRPVLGAWNVLLLVALFFGYVLYFLLLALIAVFIFLFHAIQKYPHTRHVWQGVLVLAIIGASFFFPVLELAQGFGSIKPTVQSFGGAFSSLADAFGHIAGLVAFLPQTGHVDQGNFLFNQTRTEHAPVSFLQFELWPLFFTVLVWGLIVWGLRIMRQLKETRVVRLFALLLGVLLTNYVVSWYFLDGNHILARRLDLTIVLTMSVFIALAIFYFIEKKSYIPHATKILLVTVVFAFVSSSTYASGPLLQMVTSNEHAAAKYVWEHIPRDNESYCVLANTWPLLAVEAVSARAIIGGGFPVGFEYAQPERVKIFEKMSQYPSYELLDWALAVTNESVCYYMTEDKWINDRVYRETIQLLGEPEAVVGDVYIWQYTPSIRN